LQFLKNKTDNLCLRDWDRHSLVKLCNAGFDFRLEPIAQLPQKMTLASKMVKNDSKKIISLSHSKSVTNSVSVP